MSWVLSLVAGTFLGGLLDYLFEPIRREVAKLTLWGEISVSEIVELWVRGIITEGEAIERLKGWGLSEEKARQLHQKAVATLDAVDVMRLWRLGKISLEERNKRLKALGFQENDFKLLEELTLVYPSADDIVRFAVREVFDEEVVRRYGYDQDIPKEYLEWAKKLGLSEEFARMYWRAHWEIPSPTQAIELLSRGIIDPEDFDTVLKIHDIAPWWRPRMLALAFDPYTRVDTRRMYELGILSDDDLVKAAKAVGYATEDDIEKLKRLIGDPQVAERLFVGRAEHYAAWIKAEVVDVWRNDVIRAIRRAYINGIIDENTAADYLKQVGYNEKLIPIVISFWEVSASLDALSETIDLYLEMCKKCEITPEELADRLTQLGVAQRVRDYYVANCMLKMSKKCAHTGTPQS